MTFQIQNQRRTLLAVIAFVAGGAVPIQLVTLSFGYSQYVHDATTKRQMIKLAHEFASWYIPLIYIPAFLILGGIAIYSRTQHPGLFRRIVVGFGAGIIATIALDAVRQMGVIYEWLPADTPVLFGKMATGSAELAIFLPVGVLVHYLNGANFGLFYAFVWGKRGSYLSASVWATVWGLTMELGMMTGPPMAPMVGPFGITYKWPQLFLITLIAHIFFGVALGLLVQHFLTDEDQGWLLPFLTGKTSPQSQSKKVTNT